MTQQTSDREFLDRLDAAIGCMYCEKPLPESAVSDCFCSEFCSLQYADQCFPSGRSYDYFENVDESGHGWSTEDLADLAPVSWIRPPVWRLPRSTSDLEADQAVLSRACELVQTEAQQAACDLRQDDLDERRRQANAKNWRLPRSTGNFRADDRICHEAAAMATTDAQRAACALRREDLEARRRALPKPPFPGQAARWGIDNFVFRAAPDLDPASPTYVHGPYGHGPDRSMGGVPLRYELRRDSDNNLMFAQAVSPGMNFHWEPPYWFDVTGCSWHVLDGDSEVVHWAASPDRYPMARPVVGSSWGWPAWGWPAAPIEPAVSMGDTVSISTGDGTHRYVVGIGPGGSMTCRRASEDDQPPIQGVEPTHAVIDEINPQTRALDARRNRNTGPAPRPGRIRGNVPGARS